MKKFVFLILSLALVSAPSYAQGSLLRGLGERAKQAAEKKIEKTIGDAIFGRGDSQQQPAQTSRAEEDYSATSTYAQDLMYSDRNEDFFPADDTVQPKVKFSTYSEALEASPDLSKTGAMSSFEKIQAYALGQAEYKKAVTELCTSYSMRSAAIQDQMIDGPSANAAPSSGNVSKYSVSSEEVFKALSDAGVNPATATEDQVKDAVASYVSKKYGISKAAAIQEISKPQATEISSGKNRMNEIEEELYDIFDASLNKQMNDTQASMTSLQAALLGGVTAEDPNSLSGALAALKEKIVSSWAKSDECKEINRLEAKEGFDSRARQNEIIDRWNSKQLDLWIAEIAKFEKAEQAEAIKVAELDAELEAMSAADKKTSDWAKAKSKAIMLNGVILSAAKLQDKVFECPLVRQVSIKEEIY